MVCLRILIDDCSIINLLVASFTKAARVMYPILVWALCCHLLITLGQVAEVAHEAGLVRAVHVLAYIKIVKIAQNLLQLPQRFILALVFQLTVFFANILKKLLLSSSYGLRLVASLYLWISHSVFLIFVLAYLISSLFEIDRICR